LCLLRFQGDASSFTDEEVVELVLRKHIPGYMVEKAVMDAERGVGIRRAMYTIRGGFAEALDSLPYKNYDYSKVGLSVSPWTSKYDMVVNY